MQQVPMNSSSKNNQNSKKKNFKRKKNHNKTVSKKQSAVVQDENANQNVDKEKIQVEASKDDCEPCQSCQQYYFEPLYDDNALYDEMRNTSFEDQCLSKRRNRRQRQLKLDSVKSRSLYDA